MILSNDMECNNSIIVVFDHLMFDNAIMTDYLTIFHVVLGAT